MDPMPGVLMCDALAADQGGEVEKGTSAPDCKKPTALLDWEIPRKHEPIKKEHPSRVSRSQLSG
jgi:hypothetical protein